MNEKANKNKEAQTKYAEHDIVLAKVRGYPPWPGIVVNPNSVPPRVAEERPTDKKTVYHCVKFFVAGNFGWVGSKDISRLKEHEIRAYISERHRRSGDLLTAYKTALDQVTREKEREKLVLAAAEHEDSARLEAEDEDEQEKETKPVKSKKRKRDIEGPSAKPKAKPKPKTEKKATTGRSKKNGAKSREIESEDDGDQEAEADDEHTGTSAKAVPPPFKKFKLAKR